MQGTLTIAPAPGLDAPIPTNPRADPRFLDPLVTEYLDGKNFRIVHEFDYHTDVGKLNVVRIPAGFITDFASIPQIFWNILPPTGKYGKAAVVHDYLYRTWGIATKAEADWVLLEAMKALGVGWLTRTIIYSGVHFGGGLSYKGGL